MPQLRPPTTCGRPVLLTVHWTLKPGLKPPSELLRPIGVDVIDVADLSELLQGLQPSCALVTMYCQWYCQLQPAGAVQAGLPCYDIRVCSELKARLQAIIASLALMLMLDSVSVNNVSIRLKQALVNWCSAAPARCCHPECFSSSLVSDCYGFHDCGSQANMAV